MMFYHLLRYAYSVEYLSDTLVGHVRYQPLAIVKQFQKSIRAIGPEVLARLTTELSWVCLCKMD